MCPTASSRAVPFVAGEYRDHVTLECPCTKEAQGGWGNFPSHLSLQTEPRILLKFSLFPRKVKAKTKTKMKNLFLNSASRSSSQFLSSLSLPTLGRILYAGRLHCPASQLFRRDPPASGFYPQRFLTAHR